MREALVVEPLAVVRALTFDRHTVAELANATGNQSRTLHRMLLTLPGAGFAVRVAQQLRPFRAGQPIRRYYLAAQGRR